jgi:hypothetical protein
VNKHPGLAKNRLRVVDGGHRVVIAEQAGLAEIPFEERFGLSEAEEESLAKALNAHRRQMTEAERREALREAVAESLRANPEKSNRQIAEEAKVDHKTVGAARKKLESTGEIPQFQVTVGKDDKKRPSSNPRHEGSATRDAAAERVARQTNGQALKKPEPQREPGDDTEAEANDKTKNGQVVFDDRLILDLLGKLVRAIDARATAHGKTEGFWECEKHLEAFSGAWKRWQAEKERVRR